VTDVTADGAVTDVKHCIAAVASRERSKSEAFVAQHCSCVTQEAAVQNPVVPKAYGSYAELYADEVCHPAGRLLTVDCDGSLHRYTPPFPLCRDATSSTGRQTLSRRKACDLERGRMG
jgi:endonuclease/exonuclease/phosphatase (EEP) superfamily protein YafD